MEEGTLAIRLGHPRCPFCHETVGPRDVPAPCLACRAWHHAACLDEGRQRCAACGVHAASALATVRVRERTAARSPASRRERGWSVALWLGALAVAAGVNGSVLPAFARAFREVGLSLPAPTELVLGAGGWAWGLGVLSLLHAAALVEEARTRGQLRAAAFLVGVLGAVFGCWALLLPLLTIVQRL